MGRTIPYSAEQVDLYYPCKRAMFFSGGEPKSEAGLCAEISRLAYCRQECSFAFDRDRIRKALGSVGFTGCLFFESDGQSDGRGTHCFLAIHAAKRLNVVAFRGTDKDDPTDLCDDIDVKLAQWGKGARVHSGFADALAEVLTELEPAVQAAQGRMLFTGHSLGAALATLLASLRTPDALYTFGSPMVGDAAFVASLAGVEHHRYVDCCDLVTRVPPPILGYQHHGAAIYIDRNGNVSVNPGEDVIAKDRFVAASEYVINYSWRIGDVAVRELADHAPVNYVNALINGA
jgi:hypothetical protein